MEKGTQERLRAYIERSSCSRVTNVHEHALCPRCPSFTCHLCYPSGPHLWISVLGKHSLTSPSSDLHSATTLYSHLDVYMCLLGIALSLHLHVVLQ